MSPEPAPLPADPRARLPALVHDLLTPLTVVAGFAELLESRGDTMPPEQRTEFLGLVAEGARELRAILDAERATRPDP